MKVFKFGGASVRNASGIRNVGAILKQYTGDELLVVVSAMGKTTNALEQIVTHAQAGKSFEAEWNNLRAYHLEIVTDLFDKKDSVFGTLETLFGELRQAALAPGEFDQVYDQVVAFGELISSHILARSIAAEGIPAHWEDARSYVTTDGNFREGIVDWIATEKKIQSLRQILKKNVVVVQGFIGATSDGLTTTLGREGSDFTAAIFAYCLGAESVTIWKDVPGVMNADPKRLPAAAVFEELPFQEAAEMTYYGASVIHPKTIKPLANKGIPLLVKNFDNPTLPGTQIHECKIDRLPPLVVFKENQCLISCKVTDYTFVNEDQLSSIFQALSEHRIKINVMQNSAISFSFCADFRENKILPLIKKLSEKFEVFYNTGLTLITVKNYDAKTSAEYRQLPGVILEQSSRSTLQVLVKNQARVGG